MIDRDTAESLLADARRAARNAYAPYSSFPVGAAVLTGNGERFTGVNVENASYGLTICAERAACFSAAGSGHRTIFAVAVVATATRGVTPCGACRQVLFEFHPAEGDLWVVTEGADSPRVLPLRELLPDAFGPRTLG